MVLFCQLCHAYRGFSHGCLKIQAAFTGDYHVRIRKFLLQSYSIQNQFDPRRQRRPQVGEKGEAKPSGSTGTRGIAVIRSQSLGSDLRKMCHIFI